MNRKLGWVTALLVVVGCGGPRETHTGAPASPGASSGSTGYGSPAAGPPIAATSGDFAAEVVAVDATARTVTLRESSVGGTATESPATRTRTGTGTTGATAPSGTTTVRVEGAAGAMLRDFKTGDRVVVSCTRSVAAGSGRGASSGASSTANTGSTSSVGSAGTTGAGGMGTSGGSATGSAGATGTSTGGYADTMGTGMGASGGSVLTGCSAVTAIRKAS